MSVDVFWTIELIQAFVVVVVCTMPDFCFASCRC